MSNTGKQSPLGVNVLSSLLQNKGFNINPVAAGYMGASRTNADYRYGSIVQNTCLRLLTWAINDAYGRGIATGGTVDATTYNNLIAIGADNVPALGNSKPPTYVAEDPSGQWSGEATTGYYLAGNLGQGQSATWIPYNTSNPNNSITQWGYIRLHALQAWNEFNWNGEPTGSIAYNDFTSSMLISQGFIEYTNVGITAVKNASTFLDGVYSNMNDLITADIAGVSLALPSFGQDCITAGKVIDLTKIAYFGLPSVLLQTLRTYNALTSSVALALVSAGLTNVDIDAISMGIVQATTPQERLIYGAFLVITGSDLLDVLIPLNCKTAGLTSLADLLNVKKLFPNSYQSLTVPVYNESAGPTNSKTYYPIFQDGDPSSRIDNPTINAIIGTIIPPGTPPVTLTPTENVQALSEGFGSYLDAILPRSIAVTTGAFAFSMQQLKNVQYVNFEKFAQIAASLEVTKGLDKVNGSSVPSDTALADQAHTILGLGSGPDRTYTMSDFFGCMSGLPYLWNDIKSGISTTETQKLYNIYHELFLAVTWEKAFCTISQTAGYDVAQPYLPPIPNPDYDPLLPPDPVTNPEYLFDGQPGIYNLWYTATISPGGAGGGYSRGTAPPPIVTLSPNNVNNYVTTSVATNDLDAASNGAGTFGRVTFNISNTGTRAYYAYDVTIDSATPPDVSLGGAYGPPLESISTQAPPTAILAVNPDGSIATNGTNTGGDVYTATSTYPPGTAVPAPAPFPTPGPSTSSVTPASYKGSVAKPANSVDESIDMNGYVAINTVVPISITGGTPNTSWSYVLNSAPTGSTVGINYSGNLDANGNFSGVSVQPNVAGDYYFSFTFGATGHVKTPWIRAVQQIYTPAISAPSTVAAGATFSITMSGFEPNTNIYWEVTGPAGYTAIAGSIPADSTGGYTFTGLALSIKGSYTIKSGKFAGNAYSAEHVLTVT